ncbi:SPOR domain-containing protein [Maridesulfovibrio zosterae]|uniref:SPOR domain-containing protein n=1 Tax=Maridesulfovibrio zosterae TaxID=82171 RepID=UPI000414692E|nr:SPOR domain-containing protein [Maridesulfovibrio zosterae]
MLICVAICSPAISSAQSITILGKGLYQIIPSETNKNKNILTLKDYAQLKDTVDIEAVKGTSFGFEFVLDAAEPVSTVLEIHHPKIAHAVGLGYTTIHTFPVELTPDEKYFAGWNFSKTEELQAGKWTFGFALPDSPVCEFSVTNIEELVYDGNSLKGVKEVKVIKEKTDAPQIVAGTTIAAKTETTIENATDKKSLPYGKTLTRYLVRGGRFLSLAEAEENAARVKKRGFEPFIFVREKSKQNYWYYLFIRMFDSEQEATDFATKYRQEFRRMAVPQKIKIKLAPM